MEEDDGVAEKFSVRHDKKREGDDQLVEHCRVAPLFMVKPKICGINIYKDTKGLSLTFKGNRIHGV